MKSYSVLALLALGVVFGLAGCKSQPNAAATTSKPPSSQVSSSGSAQASPSGPAWFEDIAANAGIQFAQGHNGKSPLTILEVMAGGVAIADFDGDGLMDIFLVGPDGSSEAGRCALYKNLGNEKFQDVTAGSGLESRGYYMGCAAGDVDNDGLPEILVTGYGVNRFYRNLGKSKFADVTAQAGLKSPTPTSWQSSAGFADIDNDGKLDLYIGRYVVFDENALQFCDYGPIKASCGPRFYDPQIGSLYRNLGNFRFKDVTRAMGVDQTKGKCLGVAFADINDDGWVDFYVGNDEMPGDLFLNEKGRKFREEAVTTGLALSYGGEVQGAMGLDWGDYDQNGKFDLIITTFQSEPTSLYAAMEGGVYQNRSVDTSLDKATRSYVGFGAKWVDVDNDGWLDLPTANGHIHDNQEKIDKYTTYRQPMQLFMNQQGKSFVDKAADGGPGFTTPAVGRGLAVGDLNNDGLQDMVVSDAEGAVRVLINRMKGTGHWLRVRLEGTRSNREGIGARVTLMAAEKRWIAEATTGGSYLSASDPRVHFGLGTTEKVDRIEVRWPSGKRSVVSGPHLDSEIHIKEP